VTWRLCSILTAIEISSLGQQGSKQANIPTALGGDVALFERALTAMSFVLPSQLARYAAWGLAAIKRAEIQTGGGIIPESQIRWLTRPGTVRWPGCMAPLLSPKGEELFRGMQCAEPNEYCSQRLACRASKTSDPSCLCRQKGLSGRGRRQHHGRRR